MIEHKARNAKSERNQLETSRRKDIKNSLEQNKKQLQALESEGKIGPEGKGKTVFTIYNGDEEFNEKFKADAKDVHSKWVEEAAGDPVEQNLRKRTKPVARASDRLSKATKGLISKIGKVVGEKAVKLAPGAGNAVGIAQGLENIEKGNYIEGILDVGGAAPDPIGGIIDIVGIGYSVGKVIVEENQDKPLKVKPMFDPKIFEELKRKTEPVDEFVGPMPDEFVGPPLPEGYVDDRNIPIA